MDLATQTRARNPGAHVYHFAPYEPAALKRLMGRYATREVELDALLRGRAFVDLHAVVKRALIASVERYSIKDLEPFFGYARAQDLREASMSRRIVENAIAAGDFGTPRLETHRRIVESYNREDCESALRAARLARAAARRSRSRDGHEPAAAGARERRGDRGDQRPRPGAAAAARRAARRRPDRAGRAHAGAAGALRARAHDGVPPPRGQSEPGGNTSDCASSKSTSSPTSDARSPGSSSRKSLEVEGARRRCSATRFRHRSSTRARATRFTTRQGAKVGTVAAVNCADRTIDIKKTKKTANEHPHAVFFHNRVPSDALRESLMRLGEAVLANGFETGDPWRAAIELLLRRPPPDDDGRERRPAAARRDDGRGRLPHRARARRQRARDPGPARHGQDVHRRAHHLRARARGPQGRRHGGQPQGHREPARRRRRSRRASRGIALRIVHRNDGEYDGQWGIERTDGLRRRSVRALADGTHRRGRRARRGAGRDRTSSRASTC